MTYTSVRYSLNYAWSAVCPAGYKVKNVGEGVLMRPKARELAQHGGPPGRLEDSDPVGVILYVMDGPYRLPFRRTVPVALRGCTTAS